MRQLLLLKSYNSGCRFKNRVVYYVFISCSISYMFMCCRLRAKTNPVVLLVCLNSRLTCSAARHIQVSALDECSFRAVPMHTFRCFAFVAAGDCSAVVESLSVTQTGRRVGVWVDWSESLCINLALSVLCLVERSHARCR